jgi:acetyltransferase
LDGVAVVDTAAPSPQSGEDPMCGMQLRSARERRLPPLAGTHQDPAGSQEAGHAPPPDAAANLTLRDGLLVRLRPVRAGDAAATCRLFQQLSPASRRLRFFSACPDLDKGVHWATEVDNDRRLGLVAIAADTGQLIAHAGAERDPHHPDQAEFALVIADPYQGRGLGKLLLGQLLQAAHSAGIQTLTGEVLADNHRMLNLLGHSGFPAGLDLTAGAVLVVEVSTAPGRDLGRVPAA